MYKQAKESYQNIGVDTEAAIAAASNIPVSLQCWQGDDVRGFEAAGELTGGIAATGDFPGRARCADELRGHIKRALALVPGAAKVNLHAIYGEVAGASRDAIEPRHFAAWVDFAKENGLGLDFNPTLFSHKNSKSGLTLSHPDPGIRAFWIEHCKRSRRISEYFGRELGMPSVCNIWAPDGFKDIPADRLTPRKHLLESLDEILKEPLGSSNIDAVESKLFGIGLESFTVGSHEFYLGYAASRQIALCLDSGHFHPTEFISDKISAVSLYVPRILLHVSRPVRWDSDHVVILDDELMAIAREIIRHGLTDRVHIGLDYFDASINRIAAWAIGARNMRKALLIALLEPHDRMRGSEYAFDFTQRLILQEEQKTLPWQAVWHEYCERSGAPPALDISMF